jgi:diguanylate cyclase (GGDEF)-like protein
MPATQLSASIGVATFPDHGSEIDELLRAADTALYVAKRSGRDRVALAGEGPERRVPSAL